MSLGDREHGVIVIAQQRTRARMQRNGLVEADEDPGLGRAACGRRVAVVASASDASAECPAIPG
eukprot:3463538-Lingulodinium_polyedra.AAC.1